MNVDEFTEIRPQTLMQAYRLADRQAREAGTDDEKIQAYSKVINFCDGRMLCRLDKSIKKNTLLFWAYNNVADAYIRKREYDAALNYLGKALKFARSTKEKKRVAEQIVSLRPENIHDNAGSFIMVLENALNVISRGRLPVIEKCRNVLEVCKRLDSLYKLKGDDANRQRISELSAKTVSLMKKAQKKV